MGELRDVLRKHDLIVEALKSIRFRISERRRAGDAEHGTSIRERGCKTWQSVAEAERYCQKAMDCPLPW